MDSMRSLLSTSDFLQVREHKLSNDLTVWLNEDHSQPKIFGAVVVKAGAKDSPNTGIAHYFEHMMFKGTDKIGTIDYESEKVLLDIIAEKYDALADTEDPNMRAHLQQIINDLSVRAAEYVIPNEFDRLISRFGGTKLNAGTSYDYTLYFNTFSPQYISQWAEINSERLVNPVFRLFQSELETVYEEKNMYGDTMASHREIDRTLFLSASVCVSDYRKCGKLEESPSFGDAPVLREILCRFQYGIDIKRGFRYEGGLTHLGIYFFTDTKREAAPPGYRCASTIRGAGESERTYSYAFRENYGIGIPGSSRESSGSSCAQYRRILIE